MTGFDKMLGTKYAMLSFDIDQHFQNNWDQTN
jgi:hypothetical protein